MRSGAHLNLLSLVCNRKNGNKATEVEEMLGLYFLSSDPNKHVVIF